MKKLFLFTISLLFIQNISSQIGTFTEPILLGNEINSNSEEVFPIISYNGNLIYFSRLLDDTSKRGLYDLEIWRSELKNGTFNKSVNVAELNSKFNNTVIGISKNNDTLYLLNSFKRIKKNELGLSYVVKKNEQWQKPIKIKIKDFNVAGDFYNFYIPYHNEILLISCKGPETLGEEDLYVSKKVNNQWQLPIHLGKEINSSGFEISPFINLTLDTLFFASNGHGGQGDADIFFSVRLDESWTKWTTPQNLGTVINSSKFDAFFMIHENKAYWSSNRTSEKSDIYNSTILPPYSSIEITTDIKTPSSFNAKDGEVKIIVPESNGPYQFIWSDGSTEMNRKDIVGGIYTVIITSKNGVSKTLEIKVDTPLIKQVDLDDLLRNIDPIYFDVADHKIRDDAKIELDKIIKIMNENPTIQIELGSHTDCIASENFNMKLSEKRAKSSVEYIKKGISNPERISGQGYGETMLKVDCPCEGEIKSKCNENEHQLNRRTEFVLIEKDSPKYADIAVEKMKPSNSDNKEKTTDNTIKAFKIEKNNEKTKWKTEITITDEQRKNILNGFYIVQEGETLYRVSINTGITTNQLRKINKLKTSSIKQGTKLLLK
jgi:OOP family OmpA-OmpF porin